MNLCTPTDFQLERAEIVRNGARAARLRPKTHCAKKIVSVECLNPNQKLCYEYDRIFQITLEDGSAIEVSNDFIRGVKAGGWLVIEPDGAYWRYMDDSEFNSTYEL